MTKRTESLDQADIDRVFEAERETTNHPMSGKSAEYVQGYADGMKYATEALAGVAIKRVIERTDLGQLNAL